MIIVAKIARTFKVHGTVVKKKIDQGNVNVGKTTIAQNISMSDSGLHERKSHLPEYVPGV